MMDQSEGFIRLRKALMETDEMLCAEGNEMEEIFSISYQSRQPKRILQIGEAFMAESEYVPLEAAEGRISADFVNLYPPGIPVLVPGERMENDILQMINSYLKYGYTVHGIRSGETEHEYCIKALTYRCMESLA